ncbi:hypothetical protein CCMSSC00406_0009150 [Pleurotus cornucopiae]|uniref:Uncharacterized protein n=1 Tax=Pleurotus cornucopiae TaxID=5321 RepID=A0ACB7JEN8_PLECO|nr:hypothetical protein CCMSSC00406_0009150 [Pleurotus cornucopiae]
MLDCGASDSFIDQGFVKKNNIKTKKLANPAVIRNADGMSNNAGRVTEKVEIRMMFRGHLEVMVLYVTNLGNVDVILGLTWLKKHNPEIDWKMGEVVMSRCPRQCLNYQDWQGQLMQGEPYPGEDESEEDVEEAGEVLKPKLGLRNISVAGVRQWNRLRSGYLRELDDLTNQYYESVARMYVNRMWKTHMHVETEEEEEMHLKAVGKYDYVIEHDQEKLREQKEKTEEEMVPDYYHDFMKVFRKRDSERMPVERPWDHAIELTPDFEPKASKVYPLSPVEQQELNDFLDGNLKKGYIRPSKSPQTSPVFFVQKKDGKKRLVQDYRYLNKHTMRNTYPLPLISQLVDKVAKARLFTKMDLRWGYNNVRIKEGDQWKAAFQTPRGAFEPMVMYFGLSNSPSTFQTMMNELFKDLIDEGLVVIYLDDLLIFTNDDVQKHREVVRRALKILEDNDLYVKPEKCAFEVNEVEFLGVVVKDGEVQMEEAKIEAVKNWPVPKNVQQVQQFLGFSNYY